MHTTKALFAAGLLALTAAPAAAVPDSTPEIFLHAIYDQYIGKGTAYGITLDFADQMIVFFTPETTRLMFLDETTAAVKEDIPLLSIDPFVHVPDWDIASFDIKVARTDADHAVGTVTFQNMGKTHMVRLQLETVSGAWRINDIVWDDGTTLLGLWAGCRETARTENAPPIFDCSARSP